MPHRAIVLGVADVPKSLAPPLTGHVLLDSDGLSNLLRRLQVRAADRVLTFLMKPAMPAFFASVAPVLISILLLTASNVFMPFAWYGHLRYKSSPLLLAVFVSWGIAFFVFAAFSVTYLAEPLRWNYLAAGLCVLAAAAFIFLG